MILDNKLGITDMVELARAEEKLSKAQAHYFLPYTYKALYEFHKILRLTIFLCDTLTKRTAK